MNHPSLLQLLECFGAGLGATLFSVALVLVAMWALTRAGKLESRIALWFANHPRLLSTLQVIGVSILIICIVILLTAFGCNILGVK